MAGKTAILSLKILGDAKDAQKALDDTSTSAGKLQSGVEKAALPAAAALTALAAAGYSAANAAAEDQASQAQLALALRNATGASDKQIASTEAWITKTSKAAAVADDELRPALATLARATGDVDESQKAMSVALDISAATGKDVESVSTALAKAYGGQTAGLKKLVPGMDSAVLASGDMNAIMAELARTTGGAAATAAGTAAGQMEGMKIQMAEAQEAIGAALLPAMAALAGMLAGVAGWVQENTTVFMVVGGVIGVVAAAVLALNIAFKAYAIITKAVAAATQVWVGVQWLLNAAMTANPLGLIIVAIVAIIAVIVLIATKTTWFQDLWRAAWSGIKAAAAAVWDWLKAAGPVALEGLLYPIKQVQKAFDAVVNAVRDVIDWLGRIKLPKVLTDIGDAIGGIFGRSAAPASRSAGTPFTGAPSVSTMSAAPSLSASASSGSGGGATIVIQGALDPVAVARQIRQILTNDQRRRGGVVIA